MLCSFTNQTQQTPQRYHSDFLENYNILAGGARVVGHRRPVGSRKSYRGKAPEVRGGRDGKTSLLPPSEIAKKVSSRQLFWAAHAPSIPCKNMSVKITTIQYRSKDSDAGETEEGGGGGIIPPHFFSGITLIHLWIK